MSKDNRVLCFEHYRSESGSWGNKYHHLRLLIWLGEPQRYSSLARYHHSSSDEEKQRFATQLTVLVREQGDDEFFSGLPDYVEFKWQSGGQSDMDPDDWYGGDVSFGVQWSTLEVFDRVRRLCKAADLRLDRCVDDLPQKLIAVLLKAKAVPMKTLQLGEHRSERVRDRQYRLETAVPTKAQRQERERLLAEREERQRAHEDAQRQASEPACA